MSKFKPSPAHVVFGIKLNRLIDEMRELGFKDEFIAKVLVTKGKVLLKEIG